MSYDLHLRPDVFDAEAIRDWFSARLNYKVEIDEVTYANPETGVYFSFQLNRPGQATGDETEPGGPSVAFNLNYFRPHTFALEAEPAVAAFLAQFPGRVEDPQSMGMGEGPYTREGFLKGWTHGNRFAFGVMAKQGAQRPHAADPGRIETAWAWNHSRAELQVEAGDTFFVPKIVWLTPEPGTEPETAITWTFGVATAIPESLITRVVLVRQERPKLREMFSRNPDPKFEYRLINVEAGIRLAGLERGQIDGRPTLFTPRTGPLEMQALFAGGWVAPKFVLIPPESVMGRDLVDGAWPQSTDRDRA